MNALPTRLSTALFADPPGLSPSGGVVPRRSVDIGALSGPGGATEATELRAQARHIYVFLKS